MASFPRRSFSECTVEWCSKAKGLSICFNVPMDVACFLMILLLSAFVPMSAMLSSLLTRRTLYLVDLTSPCNHKCATSMYFNLPIPCRWRMCSVAFASMTNTGFATKHKSHIILWTPVASDAPNAAACSSASALLLAMIFCFLVHAFKRRRPTSATPALDGVLVSLPRTQSESEKTCHF